MGIHGIHRQREWDAVALADAPGIDGDEAGFLALPDGSLLVDEGVEGDLTPLADAVEQELRPPYRARAVRQDGDRWAVAGVATEVVEVPEPVAGDELTLASRDGEWTLTVDGVPSFAPLPTLEALGAERFDDYVVQAARLDGDLWEVRVSPL